MWIYLLSYELKHISVCDAVVHISVTRSRLEVFIMEPCPSVGPDILLKMIQIWLRISVQVSKPMSECRVSYMGTWGKMKSWAIEVDISLKTLTLKFARDRNVSGCNILLFLYCLILMQNDSCYLSIYCRNMGSFIERVDKRWRENANVLYCVLCIA